MCKGEAVTVYIDVLFMRELIFDALLLSVTAWVLKLKWTWWKITLASTLGSLYTIALFFPTLSFMFHFSLKILISVFMLLIAFGYKRFSIFLKNIIAFYLISFLAGGVTTGLYYLFLPSANAFWKQVLLMNDGIYAVVQTSFLYLILGFAIATYLIIKTVAHRKKQQLIEQHLVNVNITLQGVEIGCTALIDTGNQLYDPLTRSPVVIIEAQLLASEFPDLVTALQAGDGSTYSFSHLSDELLELWQTKIKLIPFRSVNKDGQFIVAIKPEKLTFIHNEQVMTTNKVLLGLDYGHLSSERKYHAILHPALLN